MMARRNVSVPRLGLVSSLVLALVASLTATLPGNGAASAATPTPHAVKITVTSAYTSAAPNGPKAGDAVTKFKWMINEDNTGDGKQEATGADLGGNSATCHPLTATNPTGSANFPAGCDWPSIHAGSASSTVVSAGDQTDWNSAKALPWTNGTLGLKPGKYLVSVLADGYQLGGQWFEVFGDGQGSSSGLVRQQGSFDGDTVKVILNPYPIPLATIRAKAFLDTTPTSSTWDVPEETGLANFAAQLSDYTAPITVDYYGNPLCTIYQTTSGLPDVDPEKTGPIKIDPTTQKPLVYRLGGRCLTDSTGDVVIPNLAPGRYAVSLLPPDIGLNSTTKWVQTTTLEGAHDFDVWATAAQHGYDTELVVGGERVPFVQFGFIPPTPRLARVATARPGPGGTVTGRVVEGEAYVPGYKGLPGKQNAAETGNSGIKLRGPIKDSWVAISDLSQADSMVYAAKTNDDGSFSVSGLADGQYQLSAWDQPQDFIFDSFQFTIERGNVVALGDLPLISWFTRIEGHVFIDANHNGKFDPGEQGVPKFLMQILGRGNNAFEQGQAVSNTDFSGKYLFKEAYPLGQYQVLQFFNTNYATTGITCQADNDPVEHTYLTTIVDLSVLPIISQGGRCDIGVRTYDPRDPLDNGGIAATVLNDPWRRVFNARQGIPAPFATGVPDVKMDIYKAVQNPDGTYSKTGAPLASYDTEHWGRPTGCSPKDATGAPFTAQDAMWADPAHTGVEPDPNQPTLPQCVEAPMTGIQFGFGVDDPSKHGVQTVDGNYALGQKYTPGDYVVKMNLPPDQIFANRSPYKVSTEQDVNSFAGAWFIPQTTNTAQLNWTNGLNQGTPNNAGVDPNFNDNPSTTPTGPDAQCVGAAFTVHVTAQNNPSFAAHGGSPFEGTTRHLCDEKLVRIHANQTEAPNFLIHTDVPLPTKFSGYMVDDVSVSTDRKSTSIGEVAGIPQAPVGMYDWNNRLLLSKDSDYNGVWEFLVPSSEVNNCNTPAGLCPSVYRFVGNDPGQFNRPSVNYNPQFRTITANFHAYPGVYTPADLAPTRTVTPIRAAGIKYNTVAECRTIATDPQLFSVNRPYTVLAQYNIPDASSSQPAGSSRSIPATDRVIVIKGLGFGASPGRVDLKDESALVRQLGVTQWTDRQITVTVPANTPAGSHNLVITTAAGVSPSTALTYHVIGTGYQPDILEVGPVASRNPLLPKSTRFPGLGNAGRPNVFDPSALGEAPYIGNFGDAGAHATTHGIQGALEESAARTDQFDRTNGRNQRRHNVLLVVYPNTSPTPTSDPSQQPGTVLPANWNPLGAYFDNIIIHSPVKVQGVGPGGLYTDPTGAVTTAEPGTVLDGRFFLSATSNILTPTTDTNPGNEPYSFYWTQLWLQVENNLTGGTFSEAEAEGEVVLVMSKDRLFGSAYKPGLDGVTVQGGDQNQLPLNINEFGGAITSPLPNLTNYQVDVQGGGIMLSLYAQNFQITNNLIQQNSGSYGGAIRVGWPHRAQGLQSTNDNSSHNTNVRISGNQIYANGGTNLAGAVGMFEGSDNYRIDHNVICGNYTLEYGGGISHHGRSPGALIDHNKVVLNGSNDEGGGIMVAGELPNPATVLSRGSGSVIITDNYVADNIAGDDGGGLRFLMAGNVPISVTNNMITNNVSAHEGGGIAIDDAPQMVINNNTIAKNLTTATAVTSDGTPAPAGVSTAGNSAQLQATLPIGSPLYSNPTMFNNIFNDNRAGWWDDVSGTVLGIGAIGDPTAAHVWDVGVADNSAARITSSNSLYTAGTAAGYTPGPSNKEVADPSFTKPFDLEVNIANWRAHFRFRPASIVGVSIPTDPVGGYHLLKGSPALGWAASTFQGNAAPNHDIDGDPRPTVAAWDAGADQLPAGLR